MKAKTRGKQSKRTSPSFGSASDREIAVETKSTAFDIVIQRRADRRRKLLPQLGLSYPSDHEVLKIAELAKVDEPAAFGDHLRSIILDAHSNAALFKGLSAPKVQNILNNIARHARQLAASLREVDVGSQGSAANAGFDLNWSFQQSQRTKVKFYCLSIRV